MTRSVRATKAITLLVTSLAAFMVLLDGSIVLTALPTIQADLNAQLSDLQWTIGAYTLPFAALMLTAGTLGDRFGRKKLLLVGLGVFVIGSALCGFAPSLGWLIVGRVVQGLGAAAINPASLALLVSAFTDPKERARAIGIWTAVSGVSLALGPLVGGLLISAFGWPSIFLLNLPIGVAAMLLGRRVLVDSRNPEACGLDVPGQVLVTGGLVCLIMALIQGTAAGWGSPLIIGLFVGAVVLLVGFVVVEGRVREPLLPLDLFRKPEFSVACLAALVLGFNIVGSMFFMAQYFQGVQGGSALDAGLRLLPLTLGIFFFSPPAAQLTARVGPRPPIVVGSLLAAAGFLLLTTIEPASSFGSVWWKLGLVGAGIGLMFAPLTVAVMASTPPQRAGLGSSMINTSRIAGFTAGAAVLGTMVLSLFTSNIASELVARGVPTDVSDAFAARAAHAGAYASQFASTAGLPLPATDLAATLTQGFVDAVHGAYWVSAGLMAVVGILVALLLGNPRPPAGARPAGPASASAGRPDATEPAAAVAPTALVSAAWLAERLGTPGVRVVDCTVHVDVRPEVGAVIGSGLTTYEGGHIPGAVFADLTTGFCDPDSAKPFALPTAQQFAADVAAVGISDGDQVVVYDQTLGAWGTRMWWLLTAFGYDDVVVLDGGFRTWVAEDRPVTRDVPAVTSGRFTARFRPEMVATRSDVLAATGDPGTCLINALSPQQHAGLVPVANGRCGHIPSSVNVPAAALTDTPTGVFLPRPELASQLERAGATAADRVITYCAAGVNATMDAFVLYLLGKRNVAVYDGSLVEWSADPALPLVAEAK